MRCGSVTLACAGMRAAGVRPGRLGQRRPHRLCVRAAQPAHASASVCARREFSAGLGLMGVNVAEVRASVHACVLRACGGACVRACGGACVHACAQADARKEFDAIDVNRGGQVLFDEFCAWAARRHAPPPAPRQK